MRVCVDIYYDPAVVQEAAGLLLAAADTTPALTRVPAYRNDVVDVLRQALSDLLLRWHANFKIGYDEKDLDYLQIVGGRILALITDFDTLLVCILFTAHSLSQSVRKNRGQ